MKVLIQVSTGKKKVFAHMRDHQLDSICLPKEHEPVAFSVTSIISPAWGRFYGTKPVNPESTETLNLYQAESGFRHDLREALRTASGN